MSNWLDWKLETNNKQNNIDELTITRKFKILILLFSVFFLIIINLKLIEVLSLADQRFRNTHVL